MARKVGHIPAPKSGSGATIVVPDDIKQEIDELYAYLLEHPDEEGFAEFETDVKGTKSEQEAAIKAEMNQWQRHVRVYCVQNGIRFRQLPSKHLAPNQVRYSLSKMEPKPEPSNEQAKTASTPAKSK